MDTRHLTDTFARIGARLKFAGPRGRFSNSAVSLDVGDDRRGEFFEIARRATPAPPELAVLDARPAERHLLLMVREGGTKSKFLCGHDERHWFVAGVPEAAPVGTVAQAVEALKPAEVLAAQAVLHLTRGERNRRKNAAFVRQGEWFFLPAPDFAPGDRLVLGWEPITRGVGGKPHFVERLVRFGGESVHVCSRHPGGVTPAQYAELLARDPRAKSWGWRAMRRNPGVYVRGRVRHADHATITLAGWHRVLMNTEGQSKAMRSVAFLD